jgi:hypothetical protein
MATLEEARAAWNTKFSQFKQVKPVRVAFLGDGLGQATSNIYVANETGYLWARESPDGSKPFKVLNRQADLNPAFNLPVLIGYPEDQPDVEQILGTHYGGVNVRAGTDNTPFGGVTNHHTQHEWGGGDEVFIDSYQILPGLVKPTSPASMKVVVNRVHHYAKGGWKMFDGITTESLAKYLPESDYKYVLICLDPATNQITYRPGNVFSPDVSIDSIISNRSKTTFRHIPSPPADEMPLAAVLLEPDTTTIDWNPNGVNNLIPMRLMFGTPERDIIDRLDRLDAIVSPGGVPSKGAGQGAVTNALPGLIDASVNRIVHQRGDSLPVLLVGEIGYDVDDNKLYIGGESGNQEISGGGGGGGAEDTEDLTTDNGVSGDMLRVASGGGLEYRTTSQVLSDLGGFSEAGGTVSGELVLAVSGATAEPLDIYNANNTDDDLSSIRFLSDSDGVGAQSSVLFAEMFVDFHEHDHATMEAGFTFRNRVAGTLVSLLELNVEGSGEVVINEDGLDVDTRIESDNNSAMLFVDASADYIGVNTSSPVSPLHVNGTGRGGTADLLVQNTTTQAVLAIASTNGARVFLDGTSDVLGGTDYVLITSDPSGVSQYINYNNSNGGLIRFASATPAGGGATNINLSLTYSSVVVNDGGEDVNFRVEGDTNENMLFVDAGNNRVGIGTNSPSVTFEVSGATSLDGAVIVNESGADVNFRVEGDTNENMLFVDAGNNRVGIGTNSPISDLEISNSDGAVLSLSTDGNPGSIASPKNMDLDFAGFSDNVMARIRSWDESTNTADGHLQFWVRDNAPTGGLLQKMEMSVGYVTINGSSGDIRWDSTGTIQEFTRDGINYITCTGTGTQLYFGVENVAGQNLVMSPTLNVFNPTGADMDFRIESNNNANMLFVNAGTDRIGIRENSPDVVLHIVGADGSTDRFAGSNVSAATELLLDNDDDTFISFLVGTNDQAGIHVYSDNDSSVRGEFFYDNSLDGWYLRQAGTTYFSVYGGDTRTRAHIPLSDDTYDIGAIGSRWEDIYATNGTIQTSDIRGKEDLEPSDLGLEFVLALEPQSFRRKGGTRRHYGFVAQQVEDVLDGKDFAGLIKAKEEGGLMGLRYDEFVAILAQAVKELSAELSELKARLDLN